MTRIKLAMVAGARPNFMKIAPLMKALAGDPNFAVTLIHTGQHYDDNVGAVLLRLGDSCARFSSGRRLRKSCASDSRGHEAH